MVGVRTAISFTDGAARITRLSCSNYYELMHIAGGMRRPEVHCLRHCGCMPIVTTYKCLCEDAAGMNVTEIHLPAHFRAACVCGHECNLDGQLGAGCRLALTAGRHSGAWRRRLRHCGSSWTFQRPRRWSCRGRSTYGTLDTSGASLCRLVVDLM